MNDERRKQTEQKLIECGKAEFLEKGYAKANLRDICKAAGVTTGAFYFSFKNKEVLLVAILGPVIADYERMCSALARREEESPDAELIRILVAMRLQGYMELIKGDYTVEERLRLAKEIGIHADAGTMALIKYMNEEKKVYRR